MDYLNFKAECPFHSLFTTSAHSQISATTKAIQSANVTHDTQEAAPAPVCINEILAERSDIAQFLTRRVVLSRTSWAVGDSFGLTLNPWTLFFNNSAVKRKLENYSLISGHLKITIYINGTPFHVGMLLASYLYLSQTNELVTPGGDTHLITRSQRPHVYLNPTTCKGGTICVPLFIPQNYFRLTDNSDLSSNSIGTLDINSFKPLQQLNGGTDEVTISVFAEMVDPKLAAPTSAPVALSAFTTVAHAGKSITKKSGEDEYEDDGVVSGPASTVAMVAGAMQNVPIIGPLAKATSLGAQGIAGIARFFGYSKPSDLGQISGMRNMPVSNMALVESSDMAQKLSMTAKQELTIDPRTTGLDDTDEMSLKFLCQRESYFANFDWDVTDGQTDYIFACEVGPHMERRDSVSGGVRIIPTALSFASRPFEAWSGSITYRFQVIASQYHRGRLAIFYVPNGTIGNFDAFNTTFNTIIDLADARDFSINFKYQQPQAYSYYERSLTNVSFTSIDPQNFQASARTNGAFYVQVLNELTTPDASTAATVLVSVKAGDDFELVNPTAGDAPVFPFVPIAVSAFTSLDESMFFTVSHSDAAAVEITPVEENAPESEMEPIDIVGPTMSAIDEKSSIFYGERIGSIRALLKRYCHYRSEAFDTPNNDLTRGTVRYHAFPSAGGFDPGAIDRRAGAEPYAYNSMTYMSYFGQAYAGWRGSVRFKMLPFTKTRETTVTRVEVDTERANSYGFRNSAPIDADIANSQNEVPFQGVNFAINSLGGNIRTQNMTMDSIEFEIPYALPFRFSQVKRTVGNTNSNIRSRGYPGGNTFWINSTYESGKWGFDLYTAAGDDFAFFGFRGASVVYEHGIPSA